MMNDTKEIKEFYEKQVSAKLKETFELVKSQGFTSDAYTELRMLQEFLTRLNTVDSFFHAWNTDGSQQQQMEKKRTEG